MDIRFTALIPDSVLMSDRIRDETNKRITLNYLIQGAAAHSFISAHHLVRDELEAIRPGLTKLYDRLAASVKLNYIIGDIVILYGLPMRFWNRIHRPSHPFHHHALLVKHGKRLYREARRHLIAHAWRKWVIAIPFLHFPQMLWLIVRVMSAERKHRYQLARLAEKTASQIWGISTDRLQGRIGTDIAFGNLRTPKTTVGVMTRQAAAGYGGVALQQNGEFTVIGRSWFFPLVVHELVKGTAELVCLHGLNTLDDETYELVTDEADQLEYETPMLQSGAALWRRFLAALPANADLADTLMHVARLDPSSLEELMFAVVENTERAQAMMSRLGQTGHSTR